MADQLFTSVQVTRTATRDELMALEASVGALPPSYRAFAEAYGSGLTNGLILIFMPFRGGAGEFVSQGGGLADILEDFVASWVSDGGSAGAEDCLEPYDERSIGVAARHKDLVFFARSENGESFCWLRTGDSYAFYSLDRAFLSMRHCGDDLFSMIKDLQTVRIKQILGTGYEPLPSTFVGYADAG